MLPSVAATIAAHIYTLVHTQRAHPHDKCCVCVCTCACGWTLSERESIALSLKEDTLSFREESPAKYRQRDYHARFKWQSTQYKLKLTWDSSANAPSKRQRENSLLPHLSYSGWCTTPPSSPPATEPLNVVMQRSISNQDLHACAYICVRTHTHTLSLCFWNKISLSLPPPPLSLYTERSV